MFPLSAMYFSKTDGIQNKILDFFESADESGAGMFKSINNSLKMLNLSYEKISGFGADNTNSNYGEKNSLYSRIKTENQNIVKSNCHAHIIHNCLKHAMNTLNI